MISVQHLKKTFGRITALSDVSFTIRDGEIFGLVGANGAGKSTLLRILSDTLQPDKGEILVDGAPVHDNREVKREIFFVPEDAYSFPGSTSLDMARYFRSLYPLFDMQIFRAFFEKLELDPDKPVSACSKGTRKQISLITALAAGTRYIFLDETFDGLDPVVRETVRQLLSRECRRRGLTPVIATHSLRELEEMTDHLGLLHRGQMLLSDDIAYMRDRLQKVQCVFVSEEDRIAAEAVLPIRSRHQSGRLNIYTVTGTRETVESQFRAVGPLYYEVMQLGLEELFMTETEASGYDIANFLTES